MSCGKDLSVEESALRAEDWTEVVAGFCGLGLAGDWE